MLNSDNSIEDKGYKAGHRHTKGGFEAIERGERPMSYWTKKEVLDKVFRVYKNALEGGASLSISAHFILLKRSISVKELFKKLGKIRLNVLTKEFLEFKGTHYTGSYFRYTKFYGLRSDKAIVKAIDKLVEIEEVKQLKLF